jgi:hypothetical protein
MFPTSNYYFALEFSRKGTRCVIYYHKNHRSMRLIKNMDLKTLTN